MVQLPTPFCGPKTRSLTLDSAPATLSERLLQHEFRTSFRTQTSKRRDWAEAIAERLREYRRKWNKTPKGKAHSQRCQQSEKGKATHKRYQSSAKGKATRKKYAVSEKGKARTEKFKATEKYQALGAKLLPGGSAPDLFCEGCPNNYNTKQRGHLNRHKKICPAHVGSTASTAGAS
jgi:hypothetical protein